MDTKKIVDQKLEYWKKKLIDLSKRSNLVRYRFTKSKSIKRIFLPRKARDEERLTLIVVLPQPPF